MSLDHTGPVWPDEVVLQSDLSPAAWIAPRLLPWGEGNGTPIASVVPTGYPAYARVLHPLLGRLGAFGTWREVSEWSGRVYHPLMQYNYISVSVDPSRGPCPYHAGATGWFTEETFSDLFGFVSQWSNGAECWLGIWEGHGILTGGSSRFQQVGVDDDEDPMDRELHELVDRVASMPRFEHPHRRYLLARSPLSAVSKLSRFPLGINPNLAWPDDHSWCVGTEIDFDSTLLAGSVECITALVKDDRFEAFEVQPGDRLDIGGDVVNGPEDGDD